MIWLLTQNPSPYRHWQEANIIQLRQGLLGLMLEHKETAWREEVPPVGSLKVAGQWLLLSWQGKA